jgi:hypothetical protein
VRLAEGELRATVTETAISDETDTDPSARESS